MNDNFTFKEKICDLKPKKETLQTILAFAAVYQAVRLSNGELVEYFLN
jgi:hypothetical protein